jgi:RNA polymerase sigma-70 factor (ECF subfamily)
MTPAGPPGGPADAPRAGPPAEGAPDGGTRHSLLIRAQAGEAAAWEVITTLYRPLMVGWLRGQGVPPGEVDDLVQEILLRVVQSLPGFSHSGRVGAFRAWLRTIACHRILDYWRGAGRGGAAAGIDLTQFEDPDSELCRRWDQEHDRYVLQCLLDLVSQEFEPATVRAFQRLTLDDAPGAVVAEELGMSVGAVYVAKSRVLQRIRREAEGLID